MPLYFSESTTGAPWVSAPTASPPWIAEIRDNTVKKDDRYRDLLQGYEYTAGDPSTRTYNVPRAVVDPGGTNETIFAHDLGSRGTGVTGYRKKGASWEPVDETVGYLVNFLHSSPVNEPLFAVTEMQCKQLTSSGNCEQWSSLRLYNRRKEIVHPLPEGATFACVVEASNGPEILIYGQPPDRKSLQEDWLFRWNTSGTTQIKLPHQRNRGHYETVLTCTGRHAFLIDMAQVPIPGKQKEFLPGHFAPETRNELRIARIDEGQVRQLPPVPSDGQLVRRAIASASGALYMLFESGVGSGEVSTVKRLAKNGTWTEVAPAPPPSGHRCAVHDLALDGETLFAIEACWGDTRAQRERGDYPSLGRLVSTRAFGGKPAALDGYYSVFHHF